MTRQQAATFVTELDRVARSGILKLTTEPSEDFWTFYIAALSAYEYDACKAAIGRYIRTPGTVFFPTPGQLIEIIDGSADDRASAAWSGLTEAIRWVGNLHTIIIEDPALAITMNTVFGSWIDACEYYRENNEPTWQGKRKEFVSLYRVQRVADDQPIWCSGYLENQNRQTRASWVGFTEPTITQYVHVLTREYELQERRIEVDAQTFRPLLSVREVVALPPPAARFDNVRMLPAKPSDAEPPLSPAERERMLQSLRAKLSDVIAKHSV